MNICLGSSFLDVQRARCPIDALDDPKVGSIGGGGACHRCGSQSPEEGKNSGQLEYPFS